MAQWANPVACVLRNFMVRRFAARSADCQLAKVPGDDARAPDRGESLATRRSGSYTVAMTRGKAVASGDVTALLLAWRAGDDEARERLIEAVYATLKRIASGQLRRERPGSTLDATSLVHETYLRLAGGVAVDWRDRNHFFAIAAIAMRRILVDRARARLAQKRDAGELAITRYGSEEPLSPEEILDLDRALEKLQGAEPRLARVVEMRYFAGLENAEIGDVLGVSERTVKRDWAFARAWLQREIDAR